MASSAALNNGIPHGDDDRRILIVDDDADFADALAETLLINDFVPRTVNSAEAALAAMQDFAPALALIDIRLGQVSGLEQIGRLREIDPQLLCVIVTAYADTQTAIDALRRGADDFVRKPLRTEDMLAVLYRCIAKRQLEREKAAMEARLAQMQKSETVARLTGGVAHEFNNLLTVVLGNVHFLRQDMSSDVTPLQEKRLRWLDAIDRSAVRGAKLTRQLLSYAQKDPLRPRAVDLSHAITSLRDLLDASLGEHIRINVVLPGGLWPVEVDPNGLEEALVNLGFNARDAMASGGVMTVTVANRHLPEPFTADGTLLEPGDYVAVSVSDEGEGMPESVRARAFDPFFTTRDTGEGAGLGLSMVHGFAVQSGGAATIESRVGKGTRVTLYLPRAAGPAAAEAGYKDDVGISPSGPPPTVMVVEDNADVRRLACSLLEELGYRCIVADSGARALALLDDGVPADLLFTDVVMPGGISGHMLRDEACRRRPGLRVVFTSGHHERTILDGAEAEPFLRKPYDRESLARAIAEALPHFER